MPSSIPALNKTINAPTFRSSEVPNVDSSEKNTINTIKKRFAENGEYATKCGTLLRYLNDILDKNYSFGVNGLSVETIFNENSFASNNTICNAGKKAYAYYLKEVLQKLNLLNEHISKGQEALNNLNTCTSEAQIKNYETILEIQDGLVKKYLDDFNKYTVVQKLSTTRVTIRKSINNNEDFQRVTSPETNYDIRGKIWNEDGSATGNFDTALNTLNNLDNLRTLTTVKEIGEQTITTTLCNIRDYKDLLSRGIQKKNASYAALTNLNDKFGFNVVDKEIVPNSISKETTPIALFDELTLLEKLKYIRVYYTQNPNPYHYPKDVKSGVPCMSRDTIKQYVLDTNTNGTNNDELEALGIIPSNENKPKTDPVEPGAIELFYVGYLEDSMGAINALAAFMEIKSAAMLTQIEQQSFRIKSLKAYLKMLELAFQELNGSYEGNRISPKAYLAIKYAAANQTRTLVNINGSDYLVLQCDDGQHEHHNISKNNVYIYVKATEDGIKEFLEIDYGNVDFIFRQPLPNNKSFENLTEQEIKDGYMNKTEFGGNLSFSNLLDNYSYFYKQAEIDGYYIIEDDGHRYKVRGKYFVNEDNDWIPSDEIDHHRMMEHKERKYNGYDNFYYNAKFIVDPAILTSPKGNILFAKFDNNDQAIQHLPKELETAKVSMSSILDNNYGGVGMSWEKKNDGYKQQWRKLVEMWQNACQTATENIGSQIESANKTIKSLRSKIDTFDSSASRFRDKFYSTTMTVLNKIS